MLRIGSRVKCMKKSGNIFEGYIIAIKKEVYVVMDVDDSLKTKEFPKDMVYYNGEGFAHSNNPYVNIENLCSNIKNNIINTYEGYFDNIDEEEYYKDGTF